MTACDAFQEMIPAIEKFRSSREALTGIDLRISVSAACDLERKKIVLLFTWQGQNDS